MAHIPFEPTIAGAQAPPPYECTGVKAFGFPLLADARPLRYLCNQFLSIDPPSAGISFEPITLAPYTDTCSVTLEALDYQSLTATTPPWSDLGGASQHELLFAVPVVRKQNGDPIEVGIFIPYIFVDNPGSAFAGREVLGLPKLLANIILDRNFPVSGPIELRFDTPQTATAPAQSNDGRVRYVSRPARHVCRQPLLHADPGAGGGANGRFLDAHTDSTRVVDRGCLQLDHALHLHADGRQGLGYARSGQRHPLFDRWSRYPVDSRHQARSIWNDSVAVLPGLRLRSRRPDHTVVVLD